MATTTTPIRCRVLVADDDPKIHADFDTVLVELNRDQKNVESISYIENFLSGTSSSNSFKKDKVNKSSKRRPIYFDIDHVYKGSDAIKAVSKAYRENDEYLILFLDILMPPGKNGIETASNIIVDRPDLSIVLCTAYSDYSVDDISDQLEDGLFYFLKKPFDDAEVIQLARSLTLRSLKDKENNKLINKLKNLIKPLTKPSDDESV
jgi:CheY-like chemotaxis protein